MGGGGYVYPRTEAPGAETPGKRLYMTVWIILWEGRGYTQGQKLLVYKLLRRDYRR